MIEPGTFADVARRAVTAAFEIAERDGLPTNADVIGEIAAGWANGLQIGHEEGQRQAKEECARIVRAEFERIAAEPNAHRFTAVLVEAWLHRHSADDAIDVLRGLGDHPAVVDDQQVRPLLTAGMDAIAVGHALRTVVGLRR